MSAHERPGPRAAPETVLDRLIEHLRARNTPLDGQTRPAAILWTDPGREWTPLVDPLLQRVEEYLVLGDYAPARRTGPAVWLRCVVDGALDEPVLPAGRPPIVYLPGVARQDLRAGEECPDGLKPLVELLFRGALWRHPNGGDWTVNAFLTSRKTLGLNVAGDRATAEALLRALDEVALTPVAQLAGRHLEAEDFDRLLAGDVIRDLLRWMGDSRCDPEPVGRERLARVLQPLPGRVGVRSGAGGGRRRRRTHWRRAKGRGRRCGSGSPRRRAATATLRACCAAARRRRRSVSRNASGGRT